ETFALGGEKQLCVMKTTTGETLFELKGHEGSSDTVVFSRDGRTLVSGGADRSVRLWDLKAQREIRRFTGPIDPVGSVAISPHAKLVAASSGIGRIRVWNINTGKELHSQIGHESIVSTMTFSPDGKFLATAGYDRVIHLWDTKSHELVRSLAG